MKATPSLLPTLEPLENRRASLPEEGGDMGKTLFGSDCSLVDSYGRLSGHEGPT